MHGHARVTEIFYAMSDLNILWGEWFIQDTAYSRKTNHTTKMKVDARDYHTRLLRMLLLRYYYCYARNNSGTC